MKGNWCLTYLLEGIWFKENLHSHNIDPPFSPSIPPNPLFERLKNNKKFQEANATAIVICICCNESTLYFRVMSYFIIIIIIFFFFAGCGHCKALAPTYDQLGEAFAKADDVIIAKVDADGDKTLGSRFGVSGFPTLKYFPKGSTSAEE